MPVGDGFAHPPLCDSFHISCRAIKVWWRLNLCQVQLFSGIPGFPLTPTLFYHLEHLELDADAMHNTVIKIQWNQLNLVSPCWKDSHVKINAELLQILSSIVFLEPDFAVEYSGNVITP